MKNILIIEDSKVINNVIYQELTKLTFNVDQAFDFTTAKKLLINNSKYDLIILDLHLPDGEGMDLISNIQSLSKTKVVILTSTHDEQLREILFELGILDYIIKDKNIFYSISEIVKIINTITTKVQDKVLIIDDSKFICKQVKTILEPRNYCISNAYSGYDGLELLKKEDFDLIILDMELPDIHGVKVLENIRRNRKLITIPVIVLSGTSTPEIIRKILKGGASDFLKKPFVFEEFILKVDLWIDYFRNKKELLDKTEELEDMNRNLQTIVDREVAKNQQNQLVIMQQSRLAQMGEMIAMIAHQWRQPLTAISSASNAIKLKANLNILTNETAIEMSNKIVTYTKHLSNTIDDFRNFFKPNKDKKDTTFNELLDSVMSIIDISIKNHNIKLVKKIESDIVFYTYPNEINQVILNLIKNAEDVLLEKNIKDPTITIDVKDNVLKVMDNGGGIPKDIIDKIFDPYFSTKTEKNGTGLGLYMCKTIIEDHCGGKLKVENGNEGAIFSIIL